MAFDNRRTVGQFLAAAAATLAHWVKNPTTATGRVTEAQKLPKLLHINYTWKRTQIKKNDEIADVLTWKRKYCTSKS